MKSRIHLILPALALVSWFLFTACSAASEVQQTQQTPPQTETPTEAQPSDSSSQNEAISDDSFTETSASDDLPDGSALWLLDIQAVWTAEKEQELQKELFYTCLPHQSLTLISSTDSDYIRKAMDLKMTHADSSPLFFSAHQESIMTELVDKGVIDTCYTLETAGTADHSPSVPEETAIPAVQKAVDYFGPYFAMLLPEDQEQSLYDSVPKTIFNSTYLTDLISAPDMSPYVTSVDKRHFIYKGSTEDWTFEYETDNSVTWYDMDNQIKSKGTYEIRFTAAYTGSLDDLDKIGELTISYQGPSHGGSSTMEPPFYTTEFTRKSYGKGSNLPDGSEEIPAEVTMDGITQTAILRSAPSPN